MSLHTITSHTPTSAGRFARIRFLETPAGSEPGGNGDGTPGAGASGTDDKGGAGNGGTGGYTPPATQEDLDRIIESRLNREKSKYSDYDDLKAKASRLDELEAANATDLEKAVKKARDEATNEVTAATNRLLVQAEVRALAAAAKFRDPADAVTQLAGKLADVSVEIKDGVAVVDSAKAKALVDELATSKSYLVDLGDGGNGVVPGAGATGDTGKKTPKTLGEAVTGHYATR